MGEKVINDNGRFIIDCYGIIDTWKLLTGKCEDDKLTWGEICDTLNDLNHLANSKLNEYKLLTQLQMENKILKKKLQDIKYFMDKIEDYQDNIDSIIDEEIK
jgi:hypothetical protein